MKQRSSWVLVLMGALILSACSGSGPSESGQSGQPGLDGQNPTGGVNASQWLDTDPVILISFDGFRWDYLDRYPAPAFMEVARRGVWTDGSQPPFPSKTFPSHYTLATGLWADHHELTGNRFWDPTRSAGYDMADREVVEDGSWYSGEPIWVTAETQGMVAASYFFVGSEADVGGVRPSHWRRYDGSVTGPEKVDQVLEWLRMPAETRPRMITLYFPEVDGAGHQYGPDSQEVEQAVTLVDSYLQRLLDGLAAVPGGDRVSVLLSADHGMHRYEPGRAHALDVSGMDGVRFAEGGPYGSIFVEGDAARQAEVRDLIDAQLPDDIGVFLRADVPDHLHYRDSPRVGDIVLVPPLGVTVNRPDLNNPTGFTHGWDPSFREMHSIFLGMGPRLQENVRMGPIQHVDVYPLIAELLGLTPAPVDGDLGVWSGVLR